jgi:hypothetical protein
MGSYPDLKPLAWLRTSSIGAGRSHRVGDGEGQTHKERQPVLSLLDGYMETEREGAERASWELWEDG